MINAKEAKNKSEQVYLLNKIDSCEMTCEQAIEHAINKGHCQCSVSTEQYSKALNSIDFKQLGYDIFVAGGIVVISWLGPIGKPERDY